MEQMPCLWGSCPAVLVGPVLGAGQCFDGVLPGAGIDAVVAAGQICPGNLQVEDRLTFRIIFGFDDLLRLVCIARMQAVALAGLLVHAIEHPAADAPIDDAVTCVHISHATARISQTESDAVTDRRRIKPAYAGFLRIGKLVSVLVSVWTPQLPKPLLHTQLELEARVGIEPTNAAFAEPCLTTWLRRRDE